MRAIHIVPGDGTVQEVESMDLKDLQRFVGGFITVGIDIGKNTLYVDDEGLLKNPEYFQLWKAEKGVYVDKSIKFRCFAGNGIIVGTTKDGERTDCDLSVEWVAENVKFTDLESVRILSEQGVIA